MSSETLIALRACVGSNSVQAHSNNQLVPKPDTACYAGTIGCGQTVSGRVSVDSCDASGTYAVGYEFNGTAGQVVTISGRSYEFPATVILVDGRTGNNTIYAQKDVYVTGQSATISSFTLPSSIPYLILITPGVSYTFGDYTLSLTCAAPPPPPSSCSADSRTACMLNNRFRVSVRYRGAFDNGAADTDALVKPVTGFANSSYETAFFYFNNSNNIEMMIKMLDQGNTDGSGRPTIAVLFGSATPLRMELTITDTARGVTKRYTSPFNSMGGITDFTAFLK